MIIFLFCKFFKKEKFPKKDQKKIKFFNLNKMEKLKAFLVCSSIMIKTCIGSGILLFPIFFTQLGILPCTLYIIINGIFSVIGLTLYILCNDYYNNKKNMSTLAKKISLKLRYFSDFILISKTFLLVISYLVLITGIIKNILRDFKNKNMVFYAFLLVYVLIIFNLTNLKQLNYLKYSSTVGVFGVLYLIILSFFYFFTKNHEGDYKIIGASLKEIIMELPFFVFSFTCHQTIFNLQNDYKTYSKNFFIAVSSFSIFVVGLFYFSFGFLNMKIFNLSDKNIYKNYFDLQIDSKAFLAGKIAYLFILTFSIPIQLIPCRENLINMIFGTAYCENIEYKMGNSTENENLENYAKKNKKTAELPYNKRKNSIIRTITAFILIFLTVFISQLGLEIKTLQIFIGGTSQTIMCFLLPTIYYTMLKMANKKLKYKILSFLNVAFGFLSFTIFIISIA